MLQGQSATPTGQFIQDHVQHLRREPVEEAAAAVTLAAGHDGPGCAGPMVMVMSPLGLL